MSSWLSVVTKWVLGEYSLDDKSLDEETKSNVTVPGSKSAGEHDVSDECEVDNKNDTSTGDLCSNKRTYEKLLQRKRVTLTTLTSDIYEELPHNIIIPNLHVVIEPNELEIFDLKADWGAVECEKLKFTFDFWPCKIDTKFVDAWLKAFIAISASEKGLKFAGINSVVSECVENNIPANFPINSLTISYCNDDAVNIANRFMVNNQLKNLKVNRVTRLSLDKLLPELSVSTHVETITIANSQIVVDLSALTNNGNKTWKKIVLIDVKVDCKFPFTNPSCISKFVNLDCVNTFSVFNVIPEILHCDYDYLIAAFGDSEREDKLNSIKELYLELDLKKNCAELGDILSRVSGIQTLFLRFHVALPESDASVGGNLVATRGAAENAIISCLKSNSVDEILLWFPSSPASSWPACSLCLLPAIIIEEQIQIQTIILINYGLIFESKACKNSVLECLSSGAVKMFVFGFECEKSKPENVDKFVDLNIKYKIEHVTFSELPIAWCRFNLKVGDDCVCVSLA